MTRLALGLIALLLVAAAAPLRLADVPVPREGQWEKTSDEDGGVMKTSRHCEDGKPIDSLTLGPDCSAPAIARSGSGGWLISSNCAAPGSKSHVSISGEGDWNSAFKSEIHTTITLDGKPPTTTVWHASWRYIGPCPAGAQ